MADTYLTKQQIVEQFLQKLTQDEMDSPDNLAYANSGIMDINQYCGTSIPLWETIDSEPWTPLPISWTMVLIYLMCHYNKRANDEAEQAAYWWKRAQSALASLYNNYEFADEFRGSNYHKLGKTSKVDWTKGLFGSRKK